MKTGARSVVVAAGFVLGASAYAHHGIANFDLNRDIELEGVVTRVEFINPHSWLYLDVPAHRLPSGR